MRTPSCITLLLILAIATPLAAQEGQAEKPAASVAKPEALSARLVAKIQMSRRDTWVPSDPEKKSGVLVVIRLGPGDFATQEFTLSYKVGEKTEKGKKVDLTEKAVCRGYETGGGWAITNEEGKGWELFTGNPTTDIEFLFEIPKNTAEVSLLYKGEPTGKPVPVKAE